MSLIPAAPARAGLGLNPLLGTPEITDKQWEFYARNGYLMLGPVVSADEVEQLKTRVDDLALGRIVNPDVQLQLDTGGRYEDLPEAHPVADQNTLLYRKVQGLETDDEFRSVLQRPIFAEIAAHHYGRHTSATLFRAMVMNKPASQGTVLPWHQDGGDVWALDRDPLITIWMALDAATAANGCVEVIPGSHHLGLLSQQGSNVSPEDVARYCPEEAVIPLEVPAGHAVLMHNWLLHRSGVNPTAVPRRAFTACYLDSRTRNILTGGNFPLILGNSFGPEHPYLDELKTNTSAGQDTAETAAEYARSLAADNTALQASIGEATAYARSLELRAQELDEHAQRLDRQAVTDESRARQLCDQANALELRAQRAEAEVARLQAETGRLQTAAAGPVSWSDFGRRTVIPTGKLLLKRGRVALGNLRSSHQ